MAQFTISHSEINKGWNSFWSYIPDLFLRLTNRMYTIKNGQLWLHNDIDNPIRNNFYGTQYGSSVKTVINDAMVDDKIFKTLILESNQKWSAALKTNLTQSSLTTDNFNTRESRQFSFIRGNESVDTLQGNSVQGIGVILSSFANVIIFSKIPDLISVNDVLYQLNGANQEQIGVINSINRANNSITVIAVLTTAVNGYFSFAKKDARVEGEEVRGYYLEVELTNNESDAGELFAVSTNSVKSYV